MVRLHGSNAYKSFRDSRHAVYAIDYNGDAVSMNNTAVKAGSEKAQLVNIDGSTTPSGHARECDPDELSGAESDIKLLASSTLRVVNTSGDGSEGAQISKTCPKEFMTLESEEKGKATLSEKAKVDWDKNLGPVLEILTSLKLAYSDSRLETNVVATISESVYSEAATIIRQELGVSVNPQALKSKINKEKQLFRVLMVFRNDPSLSAANIWPSHNDCEQARRICGCSGVSDAAIRKAMRSYPWEQQMITFIGKGFRDEVTVTPKRKLTTTLMEAHKRCGKNAVPSETSSSQTSNISPSLADLNFCRKRVHELSPQEPIRKHSRNSAFSAAITRNVTLPRTPVSPEVVHVPQSPHTLDIWLADHRVGFPEIEFINSHGWRQHLLALIIEGPTYAVRLEDLMQFIFQRANEQPRR